MNVVLDTSIISVSATLIVGAFGFMYKFLRDTVKDLAVLKSSLEKQIKDGDDKSNNEISEVYKTFNEYRKSIAIEFVSKAVCDVLHSTQTDNLNGIEARLTANFNKLELKVENNFNTFLQQITTMFQNGNQLPNKG